VSCLACGFAIACGTTAPAEEPALMTIDWHERAAQGLLANGEAVDLGELRTHPHAHGVKVVGAAKPGEPSANPVIALTTIENPGITKQSFALSGWIRHQAVEGTAYLEMWTVLPDDMRYFTRTLDDFGSMKSISGDSDWREIALPFQLSNTDDAKPTKLILNLVLPGAGEVVLSNLTLTEADNATAAMSPGAWWSDQTAGVVGGIGGSLIGLIGALVGTLCGLGVGRWFVIPLLIAGSVLGGGLIVLGMVALALGQPYGVYYPLLLSGVLCELLGIVGLVVGRQRYAQAELRRMEALDA
jgi:hypothetical protein